MSRGKASREVAEDLGHSLVEWIFRDLERYSAEASHAADARARAEGDAREAGTYHPAGIALFATWLYSGDREGRGFGPPVDGQIKCRQTPGGQPRERTGEEMDRHGRHTRIVEALEPVDRYLLSLWTVAPSKALGAPWAEWIAERMAESPYATNGSGAPWTAAGVRTRITRANQRVAELVQREART